MLPQLAPAMAALASFPFGTAASLLQRVLLIVKPNKENMSLTAVTLVWSKDPNNRVAGPKYHKHCSTWALKPYYLGHWTLRETE